MLRAIRVRRNGFIQVAGALSISDEVRGFGLGHADLRAQDNTGQTHTADGGPE